MPSIPNSPRASLTSSNLNGFMIASIFFIRFSRAQHAGGLVAVPPETERWIPVHNPTGEDGLNRTGNVKRARGFSNGDASRPDILEARLNCKGLGEFPKNGAHPKRLLAEWILSARTF